MSSASTYNVDSHTTNDTLQITSLATLPTGNKGNILVDNGNVVVQKSVGPDGYILAYDTT